MNILYLSMNVGSIVVFLLSWIARILSIMMLRLYVLVDKAVVTGCQCNRRVVHIALDAGVGDGRTAGFGRGCIQLPAGTVAG